MNAVAIAPERTPEELKELKASWDVDPSWDLPATPGFEMHHDELSAHQTQFLNRQEFRRRNKLREFAAELGCPDNIALAEYVQNLEQRIAKLESTKA